MMISGTMGIFIKNITITSSETAMWRGVIATSILAFMTAIIRTSKAERVSAKNISKLLCGGLILGIDWIIYSETLRYTSIAIATLCYYFAPTIVIVASSVLFRERMTGKHMICFIASTAGLIMIVGIKSGGSNDRIGVVLGLIGAAMYATTILINKSIEGVDIMRRTRIQLLAATAILVPYVLRTQKLELMQLDSIGLVSLLVVGIVHTGLLYVVYFAALARLRGQQAAIWSYIDPLTAVAISVLLLGESMTWNQIVGGAVILISTLSNEIASSRHASDEITDL